MYKLERRIKIHSGIFPDDEQERKYLSPLSQNRKSEEEKAQAFHFSRCQLMNIAELELKLVDAKTKTS